MLNSQIDLTPQGQVRKGAKENAEVRLHTDCKCVVNWRGEFDLKIYVKDMDISHIYLHRPFLAYVGLHSHVSLLFHW